MSKTTMQVTTLASIPGGNVTDLVVAPDALWWIVDAGSSGTVYRQAKTGNGCLNYIACTVTAACNHVAPRPLKV
ncbi:MAG: hypothetical protein NVS3B20_14530 [Polyangiales bacterium]